MKINLVSLNHKPNTGGNPGLKDQKHYWPNLALMKLSAWHKKQGHEVTLNGPKADLNYVSCVFTKRKAEATRLVEYFGDKVKFGGSGFGDYSVNLSNEIELITPDYTLYPDFEFSIGFTSRGCIRRCPFCIVPDKEGKIREHSKLSDFVRHKKVVLIDNNFLASPAWEDKLIEMIDRDLAVDFNQGLDIRLMNERMAELLAKLKPEKIRFAFDDIKVEKKIVKGIKLLKSAGYDISFHNVMSYVLVGYNSTIEEDIYRCELLHGLGVLSYVMVYEGSPKILHQLKKWSNTYYMEGWREFPRFKDWLKVDEVTKPGTLF